MTKKPSFLHFFAACRSDLECDPYHVCLLGRCVIKECEKPVDNDLQIFKPTKSAITIGAIVEMQCKPGKIFGPGMKTIKLICRDNEEVGRGELVTLDGMQKGSCYPGLYQGYGQA